MLVASPRGEERTGRLRGLPDFYRTAPDLVADFDDHRQLSPLLVLSQGVVLLGRDAALEPPRQLDRLLLRSHRVVDRRGFLEGRISEREPDPLRRKVLQPRSVTV